MYPSQNCQQGALLHESCYGDEDYYFICLHGTHDIHIYTLWFRNPVCCIKAVILQINVDMTIYRTNKS